MLKKIVFGSVGILFLASPLLASADTLSDLQAQIQALLAQIAALQGQTQPVPPPTGNPDDYGTGTPVGKYCPTLSITMQRGSRDLTTGGQVTELQIFLASYFDLNEEDVVSGFFGKLTQANVIKFQQQNDLPAFGIAGVLTRAKIAEVCGGGTVVPPQPPVCPVAIRAACPSGQHYETAGSDTVDSHGCHFANLKCVPNGDDGTAAQELGTLQLIYKGKALPQVTNVSKSIAQQMCGRVSNPVTNAYVTDSSCSWNGQPIQSVFGGVKDGDPSIIHFLKPVGGQNETIEIGGGQYAFTLSDQASSAGKNYHVYLARFEPNVSQSEAQMIYEANIRNVERSGSTAYLKWDFMVDGSNAQVPPGAYYISVINSETGAGGSVSAYTYLVPSGTQVPIMTLTADPTSVTSGGTTQLAWSAQNATNCGLDAPQGTGFGLVGTSGSRRSNPIMTSTTFTLTCYGTTGTAKSINTTVSVVGAPSGITVTAPNGGEQWEIGKLNTITWSPYSYNPDINPASQIIVELMRKNTSPCPASQEKCAGEFEVVGRIMDTGKASLHTYFNINSYDKWAEPGQYYVRVRNDLKGTMDVSDAPFTLLPRAVDLKINGSDGPVTVKDNEALSVSWALGHPWGIMEGGCTLSGVRATAGGAASSVGVGVNSGSATYYAYAPTQGAYTSVHISCVDGAKGLTHSDYASVVSAGGSTPASLQITSPNGGEQQNPQNSLNTTFKHSGIKSYSVALYRNDQWYAWIAKDQPITDSYDILAFFTPADLFAGLGTGDNAGAIFKIYITGQKADGTGYVDDKSDAPFSFVGVVTPTDPNDWIGGCASPPVYTGPDAYVGKPYSYDPGVYNAGAPYPALPSALVKSNGIITGTPLVAGPVSVKVFSTNSCGAFIIKFNVLAQQTPTVAAPHAGFDSYLTDGPLSSKTPTISGTASNTNSINVMISLLGVTYFNASAVPVVNGKWSVTVSPALSNGSYALALYDYATGKHLMSTTIKIDAVSTACQSGVGTYKEYRDNVLSLDMQSVDCAWAYKNCKGNAERNFPTKVVRCTWNEIEIYNSATGVGASAAAPNTNLANALMALELALKALIEKLR